VGRPNPKTFPNSLISQGRKMTISDLLLKPEAAAQALNIGRSKIYQLMEAGEIESVKIGRSRRISVKALEAFTEKLTQEVRGA
jgi:excisionase family DNA binding protein